MICRKSLWTAINNGSTSVVDYLFELLDCHLDQPNQNQCFETIKYDSYPSETIVSYFHNAVQNGNIRYVRGILEYAKQVLDKHNCDIALATAVSACNQI